MGTRSCSPKLEGDNSCSLLGQPPAQVLPAPRIACREDLVEGADAALWQLPLERHPLPQAAGFCTATTAISVWSWPLKYVVTLFALCLHFVHLYAGLGNFQ